MQHAFRRARPVERIGVADGRRLLPFDTAFRDVADLPGIALPCGISGVERSAGLRGPGEIGCDSQARRIGGDDDRRDLGGQGKAFE